MLKLSFAECWVERPTGKASHSARHHSPHDSVSLPLSHFPLPALSLFPREINIPSLTGETRPAPTPRSTLRCPDDR